MSQGPEKNVGHFQSRDWPAEWRTFQVMAFHHSLQPFQLPECAHSGCNCWGCDQLGYNSNAKWCWTAWKWVKRKGIQWCWITAWFSMMFDRQLWIKACQAAIIQSIFRILRSPTATADLTARSDCKNERTEVPDWKAWKGIMWKAEMSVKGGTERIALQCFKRTVGTVESYHVSSMSFQSFSAVSKGNAQYIVSREGRALPQFWQDIKSRWKQPLLCVLWSDRLPLL